jgi:PIN domain nuclease of toxin-antitoxin system
MRWWHSSKDRVVRLLVDTRILLWAAMDPERLPASFREYIDELPVTAAHVARVSRLPLHHRDPTDRPLIAQALHEPMCFLTLDRTLTCYSDLVEVGT